MATIKCPDCGKEVSTRATSCPGCAGPIAADLIECSECGESFIPASEKACPSCGCPVQRLTPQKAVPAIPSGNTEKTQDIHVPVAAPPRESSTRSRRRTDRDAMHGASPSVTVNVNKEESVAFAVVTLLFYIFLFPVGLLLNLVGLITGPKKGCFGMMILLFIVLPIVLGLLLGAMGIPVLEQLINFVGKFI